MENWKSYARCFFKNAAATPGTMPMDNIRGLVGDTRGRLNDRVLTPDEIRSKFVTPKSPRGSITMTPPKLPAKPKPSGLVNGINNITRGLLGIPRLENRKEYEGIRGRGFADPSKYLGPENKYPQIPQERRDLLKRNSDEYIRLLKSRPRLLSQGL